VKEICWPRQKHQNHQRPSKAQMHVVCDCKFDLKKKKARLAASGNLTPPSSTATLHALAWFLLAVHSTTSLHDVTAHYRLDGTTDSRTGSRGSACLSHFSHIILLLPTWWDDTVLLCTAAVKKKEHLEGIGLNHRSDTQHMQKIASSIGDAPIPSGRLGNPVLTQQWHTVIRKRRLGDPPLIHS